ncbi:hypothetical protein QYM36_015387 [Artemia franciscana]|uniref:Uncharacterized protein n=1 Tax=Artemia franciscana TaxID=6661 RepID=A0AA88HMN3_ARTSF|nr:hypothetical protein QYM36_015387 [Artemia franciscana]
MDVRNVEVLPFVGSDHFPVLIEILQNFPTNALQTQHRGNFQRKEILKREMSKSEIHKIEEKLLDKKVQEELKVLKEGKLPVDQMIDGLNGIIHEITPKVSPKSERKEFFDDECLVRKKELMQLVEKVKALKESPLKVTVVLQMKAIRQIINSY